MFIWGGDDVGNVDDDDGGDCVDGRRDGNSDVNGDGNGDQVGNGDEFGNCVDNYFGDDHGDGTSSDGNAVQWLIA